MSTNRIDHHDPMDAPIMLTPVRPTCEYAVNPIGIETSSPRFSWQLMQAGRGKRQTAYRILVASSMEELNQNKGTLWDTGKVISNQTIGIPYAGNPLTSGQICYWKLSVWDLQDHCGGFSEASSFEMGLLNESDWQGSWIGGAKWKGVGNFHEGPALLFRKEFSVSKKVKRARAYISGLGYYVMSLNGNRVGDHELDPGFTDYSVRVLYATYDITMHLKPGPNMVGVMAGNGWYCSIRWRGTPCLKLQMNIEYTDGTTESITSGLDQGWQVADSPIVKNSVYDGEIYDARLEMKGWDTCNAPSTKKSRKWRSPIAVKAPGGRMVSQVLEPIKAVEEIRAVSKGVPNILSKNRGVQPDDFKKEQDKPAEWNMVVFDLGQNIAGRIRLKVKGPKGTKVTIKHGETLLYNGAVNTANLYMAQACDTYILKGEGVEIYEPTFTYHGFRYVQLEGYPGEPDLNTVTGIVVHSAVRQTGHFECSHPLINQIHKNILWTERDNLHSVPTDCPQRNERFGWLNDTTARNEEAVYNYDLSRLLPKWMDDIRDTQTPTGAIADCAPFVWWCSNDGEPVNSTYVITLWLLYRHYGDVRILQNHYDSLQKWLDFLDRTARDHILYHGWIGDWAPPRAFAYTDSICSAVSSTTTFEYISTGYYFLCAKLMTRIAHVLGNPEDEQKYQVMSQSVKQAFNEKFLNRQTMQYGIGSQAAHAFALYLGLVPEEARQSVLDHLVNDVLVANNGHLTTGNLCTKYLLEALTNEGRVDVAWTLATQTTYPSWGYMISKGATTIWERWEYETGREMNSHNHPMYGSIGAWFYLALAGINVDEDGAGFDRILIRPRMVDRLSYVNSALDTVRGEIVCNWERGAEAFNLSVCIPANCSARVILPMIRNTVSQVVVKESDELVWDGNRFLPGVADMVIGQKNGEGLSFLVGSGSYHFVMESI